MQHKLMNIEWLFTFYKVQQKMFIHKVTHCAQAHRHQCKDLRDLIITQRAADCMIYIYIPVGVVKEILFQSIINKTDDNDQLEDEGFSRDVSFL